MWGLSSLLLSTKEQVQKDGEDDRDQDHKTYRRVEREVAPSEDEVPRQPVDPEPAEQEKDDAEHEQHNCPTDE